MPAPICSACFSHICNKKSYRKLNHEDYSSTFTSIGIQKLDVVCNRCFHKFNRIRNFENDLQLKIIKLKTSIQKLTYEFLLLPGVKRTMVSASEPAYKMVVCKVEPPDEKVVCKVEPPDEEVVCKVEPPDEEIDYRVELNDEEMDFKVELADEEDEEIEVEPSDEQSMQTEVTFVRPHRITTETANASVQTIESKNDHDYAKHYKDNTNGDISMHSESSQDQASKVYERLVNTKLDEVTIDYPVNIGEVEVTVESLSFKKFFSDIKENINEKYSVYETDSGLTLIDFYNISAALPAVKLTVKIDSGFECHVSVHGKEIPRSHSLWTGAPEFFHDADSALKLLKRLDSFTVCCGNPEPEFHELVPIGSELINCVNTDVVAYREGDFGAFTANGKLYSSTIRSKSCEYLTTSKEVSQFFFATKGKCIKCKQYEYALKKRKKRLEKRKENPRKFNHSTFKHTDMTREELCSKLNEQKVEITDLKCKIYKLKRKLGISSQKDGVIIKEHENTGQYYSSLMNIDNS